ncbi:galactokinase [Elizabethkingia meningoseptica]|uniref:galactokinase n=2 Tax=Elizabethkingia meningoseptica TaxID=238 RepID=UPI0008416177|nr:galactokinase [Elizabethkingia meningoseptica]MDE5437104.1 galactokinase [Elizabethkingia meningoseptica]MDE5448582.1 galactokinase [Elizabethkingia meningoseptica]MDE5470043.1 galactokinase [Elizabethkingia meningoseptica]MDE5509765.1 galactokinase [Elizabethkingia meningoseptica]MDE5514386.1 galactokinase [Elizabethkingia meningoseptica]
MSIITKEYMTEKFENAFGQTPDVISKSPGRINIIGEHTDYNDGFVLPAAIDKYSYVAAGKRSDDEIHLFSELYQEELHFKLTEIQPQGHSWVNYILGVVHHIQHKGFQLGGFNMFIDGDVPLGAGVSSSASLECAVGIALDKMFGLGLSQWDITTIAQSAEHSFAGVKCGIMDQFASVFSKENKVARLDCRSLEFKYFPLELGEYTLLLLNTNVKHSLASSAYNERREACEKAVEIIQKDFKDVKSLRDVSGLMLREYLYFDYPELHVKASYVYDENQRVEAVCEALEKGDLERAGQLIYQSHEGLRDAYEVSCAELDFLVDEVKQYPEVLGARMMGGGFGGCTLNLVKKSFVPELIAKIKPAYESQFGLELTSIEVVPSEGGHIL